MTSERQRALIYCYSFSHYLTTLDFSWIDEELSLAMVSFLSPEKPNGHRTHRANTAIPNVPLKESTIHYGCCTRNWRWTHKYTHRLFTIYYSKNTTAFSVCSVGVCVCVCVWCGMLVDGFLIYFVYTRRILKPLPSFAATHSHHLKWTFSCTQR